MIIERIYGEGGYLYGVDLVTLKSDEDWTTVVFAIALAAIQIGIGIALASSGAGVFATTFGKSLIFQGIGDVISTVELLSHGHSVDMDNFMKSKGVSIAIALITASIAHIGNKLAPNMKAFQGNNPFVDSKGNSISVSEYLIKQTAIAGGMHLLGKEISKVGETLLKDSSVQDAVAEVINDHLEDLKIIFGSDDWQAYLKKLLAEEQNIIKSHTNKYHNDGVTIAKRVAGNVASMFAGNFNFVGAAVAGSIINVGAGIAEVTAINNEFTFEFGIVLRDLANNLQKTEITITDEELRSRIEAFRTNLQRDIFNHMSGVIQNNIINPVANVLGTPLMNMLVDKLYQKTPKTKSAPKQKQTGPAKKTKQNVYEEAALDEEFVVLKDIVLEDDFVTASDEAEFPPFKKAEKFKYAPDQKSIDEIVKLFHQNKAPSANYDGECANYLPHIFNLQDYFHSHEYDPKQLGTLSAVTGRPVHLYKDGIKIGEANNIRSLVMRPIEINYNTDTRMYHSMGDGLSFYGRETIIDVALQDQAIFASYATQTNLQNAMNSFQNANPFWFASASNKYEYTSRSLWEFVSDKFDTVGEFIDESAKVLVDHWIEASIETAQRNPDKEFKMLNFKGQIYSKMWSDAKRKFQEEFPGASAVIEEGFDLFDKTMASAIGYVTKQVEEASVELIGKENTKDAKDYIKKKLLPVAKAIDDYKRSLSKEQQETFRMFFRTTEVIGAGELGIAMTKITHKAGKTVVKNAAKVAKAANKLTNIGVDKLTQTAKTINRLSKSNVKTFATAEGVPMGMSWIDDTCPKNVLFNMADDVGTKIKPKTKLGEKLADDVVAKTTTKQLNKLTTKIGEDLGNGFKHHVEIDAKLLKKEINLPTDLNSPKLRKKFDAHKDAFGMQNNNFNKKNAELFTQKVRDHVSHPDTIPIAGKYTRGGVGDVVHYYNPKTKINVMKDLNGNFVSGWELSREQREFLKTLGKIGKRRK